MKLLIATLLSALPLYIFAQTPEGAVKQLFIATDNKDWQQVESCFADQVALDYSSMTGSPAATLSPSDITGSWKTVLPGFTHTHHQIGNMLSNIDKDKAMVFCYGMATHYLEDDGGNIWTVVGSYDFTLKKENDKWLITGMKFNYKYQDGNTALVQKAIENVKQK